MQAATVGLGIDGDCDQGFQRGLRRGISFSKELLNGGASRAVVAPRFVGASALSGDVVTSPSIGAATAQLALEPVETVGASALAEAAHPSGTAGAGTAHGIAHRVRLTLAVPAAVASVPALGTGHGAVRSVPTRRAETLARRSIALGIVGAATLLGTVGTESARNTSVFAVYSSVSSGTTAFPGFPIADATISAVASQCSCAVVASAGNLAAFTGPFAVRNRRVALSGDRIAAGAVASVGTLGSPRSLRATVLALASRETLSAHTLPIHGVAPQGVGAVAFACPGTAGPVSEWCAREVAESAVAGGGTLAVAETSVTAAARAVLGTQALAPITETSEGAHVVTAMLAVPVRCTAAAACLVIAQGRGVAEAFLLAVNAVHTLGTLRVAKFSDVSWLAATYFSG